MCRWIKIRKISGKCKEKYFAHSKMIICLWEKLIGEISNNCWVISTKIWEEMGFLVLMKLVHKGNSRPEVWKCIVVPFSFIRKDQRYCWLSCEHSDRLWVGRIKKSQLWLCFFSENEGSYNCQESRHRSQYLKRKKKG